MRQDIREMLKEDRDVKKQQMPKGHQERFQLKLEDAFPKKTSQRSYRPEYMKIAALFVIALGVGGFLFFTTSRVENTILENHKVVETPDKGVSKERNSSLEQTEQFQLSEISPQYKKIEDYYMASLNLELSKLEINKENKALIDSFMKELSGLDDEYKKLNNELKELGPNEQTIEAMVSNLQLRLALLFKLKQKLKEITGSKNKSYENVQA